MDTPTESPEATVNRALGDEITRTVAIFQALAHPVRLQTLLELARLGERSAGELQRAAGIEQSAMSHQLRLLREARLVTSERRGRRVLYRLVDRHVAHIVEDALAHAGEAS